MSGALTLPGFALVALLGRGVLLFLLLRALGALLKRVPVRTRSKVLLARFGPLTTLLVCLGYLLWGVQQLFGAHMAAAAWLLGLLLPVSVLALWTPIRDLLTGVFLRAGGAVRVGDELELEELRGHVEALFDRSLLLRTRNGEAFVPYGKLARATIIHARPERSAAALTFRVRPITGIPRGELRRLIVESALLCHWASPTRPPELVDAENGAVDVTIFAIGREYRLEVESAVRTRLATAERARADEILGHARHVALPYDDADRAEGSAG